MRATRIVTLLICVLLLLLPTTLPPPVDGFFYVHLWRVSFSGTLYVGGNQSYPVVPIWDFIDNTSSQICEQRSFTMKVNNASVSPTQIIEDIDGNPQLILNLSTPLQPRDLLSWEEEWLFTVADREASLFQLSIDHSETLGEIAEYMDSDDRLFYTLPTSLWNTQNDSLIELATNIRDSLPDEEQENVLALTLAAIEWIKGFITTSTTILWPQYPEETIASLSGDCDDQANLLITLLRILGIPSYLLTGHWYQEGTSTTGYQWGSPIENAYLFVNWKNVAGHGWAMVFVPPWGWLPFDLTAEGAETDPVLAYSESLYASGLPLVSLWQVVIGDYIAELRALQNETFEYQLRRAEYEEWTNLGSIPILDAPYITANIATIIALSVTLVLLTCFVGIAIRRQRPEDGTA